MPTPKDEQAEKAAEASEKYRQTMEIIREQEGRMLPTGGNFADRFDNAHSPLNPTKGRDGGR